MAPKTKSASEPDRTATRMPTRVGRRRAETAGAEAQTASVIMQARVERAFAQELLEHEAAVLGLDGASAVVREGLRLVHDRAREAAMVAAYEEFYQGEPAPLPTGVAPAASG